MNKLEEYEGKCASILEAHGVTDIPRFNDAIRALKIERGRRISTEEFESVCLEFGVNKTLYPSLALLLAKTYSSYDEYLIENAYVFGFKNAAVGAGAFILVGLIAYAAVKYAPNDSVLGEIRGWFTSGGGAGRGDIEQGLP
ncbi:hypothetical protein [Pseudooceanicola nitratireducens]|uniref:hypothetical protein n=1 Tax=Pseudooceanicola nitratireducens TaxID=517719 RepID=UPI003C7E8D1A